MFDNLVGNEKWKLDIPTKNFYWRDLKKTQFSSRKIPEKWNDTNLKKSIKESIVKNIWNFTLHRVFERGSKQPVDKNE